MRNRSRAYTFAVFALISLSGVGCFGYKARPLPAPSPARQLIGSPVRVTMKDGTTIEFASAYVEGDSVSGVTNPPPGKMEAVALSSIASIQTKGFQVMRTVGVAGVVTLAIGVAVLAAILTFVHHLN